VGVFVQQKLTRCPIGSMPIPAQALRNGYGHRHTEAPIPVATQQPSREPVYGKGGELQKRPFVQDLSKVPLLSQPTRAARELWE
jgi:hypothetical protein